MIFSNGSSRPLNTNSGTVPDVSEVLLDWFQKMTFDVVVKTVSGFELVETTTPVEFQGVIQPLSGSQLMIKPEGQRAWNWMLVHADPSLSLDVDDVVLYLGTQYRVYQTKSYDIYGYREYQLAEDYTGSGPT